MFRQVGSSSRQLITRDRRRPVPSSDDSTGRARQSFTCASSTCIVRSPVGQPEGVGVAPRLLVFLEPVGGDTAEST